MKIQRTFEDIDDANEFRAGLLDSGSVETEDDCALSYDRMNVLYVVTCWTEDSN